jgi:hypothetical protein
MAAGNTGNLPLVLVASLASDPDLPLLLGQGEAGLQFVILSNLTAAFIQVWLFLIAFHLILPFFVTKFCMAPGSRDHAASSMVSTAYWA